MQKYSPQCRIGLLLLGIGAAVVMQEFKGPFRLEAAMRGADRKRLPASSKSTLARMNSRTITRIEPQSM